MSRVNLGTDRGRGDRPADRGDRPGRPTGATGAGRGTAPPP